MLTISSPRTRRKLPIGAEGLLFLPYLTGERTPHADPNARGAFVGLGLRHTKWHLARAIMESVCYGLRDSLEILREMQLPLTEVRAHGRRRAECVLAANAMRCLQHAAGEDGD